MIILPSASAGFQSSSLAGVNSLTINSPNTIVFFTLKANTELSISNIFGAMPAWASDSDFITFWADRNFINYYLQAIYDGSSWLDVQTFDNVTNTIVPSNYNTLVVQPIIIPATIPLLNGNLAINKMFN